MSGPRTELLARLLADMFREDELRRFVLLRYRQVHDSVAWGGSPRTVATDVADAFARRKLMDAELRAALQAERPQRAGEIAAAFDPRARDAAERAEILGARARWVVLLAVLGVGVAAVVAVYLGALDGEAPAAASAEPPAAASAEPPGATSAEPPAVASVEPPAATSAERPAVATPEPPADASAAPARPIEPANVGPASPCPEGMVLVTPDARFAGDPPFCLDRQEVSRERYGLRCPSEGGDARHVRLYAAGQQCDRGRPDPSWGSRPVVLISWAEAGAFCRSQGGRLPNYREWTIAASMDLAPRLAPQFAAAMNLCSAECEQDAGLLVASSFHHRDGHARSAPVGAYRGQFRSRLGVDDLYGNAREWVVRDGQAFACGSGWKTTRREELDPALCASRFNRALGDAREEDVGFRCARDLPARR